MIRYQNEWMSGNDNWRREVGEGEGEWGKEDFKGKGKRNWEGKG